MKKFFESIFKNGLQSEASQKGFTLAEVLITLVVIGIIAALTIPTVLSKVEKAKNLAVLKRAYAELGQNVTSFAYANDCQEFRGCMTRNGQVAGNFSRYLISDKGYKSAVADNYNGSIKIKDLKDATKSLTIAGTNSSRVERLLRSPNGEFLYLIQLNGGDNTYYDVNKDYFRGMVYIFTNNKTINRSIKAGTGNSSVLPVLGKDVFIAFIMDSGRIIPNGTSQCSNWKSSWTYNCKTWQTAGNCSPEGGSSGGEGCLSRIIEEGWEMNYLK